MKRVDFIRHLEHHGCRMLREGSNHSLFVGPTQRVSTVPRHRELNDFLARRICRALEIPEP
ncbi:MAG: type II toxin-antitoxin system HicA family toxin [Gemmatimonadaceae bacterium]